MSSPLQSPYIPVRWIRIANTYAARTVSGRSELPIKSCAAYKVQYKLRVFARESGHVVLEDGHCGHILTCIVHLDGPTFGDKAPCTVASSSVVTHNARPFLQSGLRPHVLAVPTPALRRYTVLMFFLVYPSVDYGYPHSRRRHCLFNAHHSPLSTHSNHFTP